MYLDSVPVLKIETNPCRRSAQIQLLANVHSVVAEHAMTVMELCSNILWNVLYAINRRIVCGCAKRIQVVLGKMKCSISIRKENNGWLSRAGHVSGCSTGKYYLPSIVTPKYVRIGSIGLAIV